MKNFSLVFFVFFSFCANGQATDHYKKVKEKFVFASKNKRVQPSIFRKAKTSFINNALNTNACTSQNYGCAAIVPLSVANLQFSGQRESENYVILNWSTKDEINNKGFEIQRKIGVNDDFIKIGFVKAVEQKSTENKYEFLEVNDANETSYYRLKIIENSGNYTFSKIIDMKSFDQSLALKIASNPIIGDEIVLEIFGLKTNENVDLAIFDMLGRKIFDLNKYVLKTNSTIKITKNNAFKIGRYFVRASFKDKVLLNNFVIAQ